jgi:ankyrin repeat protein/L-ascorbate metabolism protein UlaG (beta-lactamase superfamily)
MATRRVLMLSAAALIGLAPAVRAGEIHQAVAAGDSARVASLLRANAGLVRAANEDPSADLPLHVAARTGHVGIARLLLDAGADVDGPDSDESTPLDVAAVGRQREMARLLLDRGANVSHRDHNGSCALSFAVSGGDTAIVRMLLRAGADLNYVSPQGATLLHIAGSRGRLDVVDLLLARGGDINRGNGTGQTPLHWATRSGDSTRVAGLVARGARVNAPDSSGSTPLGWAIEFGKVHSAAALLAAGADPNAAVGQNPTPLLLSVWRAQPAITRLLLAHGADPNLPGQGGRAVLTDAVVLRNAEFVALLLEAGAHATATDGIDSLTLLHRVAISGRADLARVLLEHGANASARDRSGATPLDLAVRYRNRSVANLLVARHAPGPGWRNADERALAGARGLADGQAAIWFLGHSAWGIKTRNHFLVFDYTPDDPPADEPSLCNGFIAPEELKNERVTVFVSHDHADHFDPRIFGWRGLLPQATYVLGFRADTLPAHVFMGPRETREVDGMKVTTIRANDTGVGFVVEVDGLVLFHAGDHANRNRDLSGDFTPEIEFLKARGVKPDIAMLPVTGCGFGDHVAVESGVEYAIGELRPALFLPMHGGWYGCDFGACEASIPRRFPHTRMVAVSNRGDHLRYRKGQAG